MSDTVNDAIVRLVEAHRRGIRLALLFDYDGTLVPIAPHPEMAVMSDETRARLKALVQIPEVFVGVLSGRAILNLREMVGIKGVFYAGTNGLELSFGETVLTHPDSERGAAIASDVAAHVRQAITGYEGAWVEQKPLGLTVHFRRLTDPERIPNLRTDVARAIGRFTSQLRVLDGPMAVEIMPNLGWTKGSALRMLVGHIGGTTVLPLYAGDDANDRDAFMMAATLGGIAIGVGRIAPHSAQYQLPDPAALHGVIDELLRMLAPVPLASDF